MTSFNSEQQSLWTLQTALLPHLPESYNSKKVNFSVKLHSLSHKADLKHIISVPNPYFIPHFKL